MTDREIQEVLNKCEVPYGEFIWDENGALELVMRVTWLKEWLENRRAAMEAPDRTIMHVRFRLGFTPSTQKMARTFGEEDWMHLAYSLYRGAMLHECSELFLYKGRQLFNPHCLEEAELHVERPGATTLEIEASLLDGVGCRAEVVAR